MNNNNSRGVHLRKWNGFTPEFIPDFLVGFDYKSNWRKQNWNKGTICFNAVDSDFVAKHINKINIKKATEKMEFLQKS